MLRLKYNGTPEEFTRAVAQRAPGTLVHKARVDTLIASGIGERFDPRHDGRLMKEWLVIEPTSEEKWLPLAREAMRFVALKQ